MLKWYLSIGILGVSIVFSVNYHLYTTDLAKMEQRFREERIGLKRRRRKKRDERGLFHMDDPVEAKLSQLFDVIDEVRERKEAVLRRYEELKMNTNISTDLSSNITYILQDSKVLLKTSEKINKNKNFTDTMNDTIKNKADAGLLSQNSNESSLVKTLMSRYNLSDQDHELGAKIEIRKKRRTLGEIEGLNEDIAINDNELQSGPSKTIFLDHWFRTLAIFLLVQIFICCFCVCASVLRQLRYLIHPTDFLASCFRIGKFGSMRKESLADAEMDVFKLLDIEPPSKNKTTGMSTPVLPSDIIPIVGTAMMNVIHPSKRKNHAINMTLNKIKTNLQQQDQKFIEIDSVYQAMHQNKIQSTKRRS